MGVNSFFPTRSTGCEDVAGLIARELRLTAWDAASLHPGRLKCLHRVAMERVEYCALTPEQFRRRFRAGRGGGSADL